MLINTLSIIYLRKIDNEEEIKKNHKSYIITIMFNLKYR